MMIKKEALSFLLCSGVNFWHGDVFPGLGLFEPIFKFFLGDLQPGFLIMLLGHAHLFDERGTALQTVPAGPGAGCAEGRSFSPFNGEMGVPKLIWF